MTALKTEEAALDAEAATARAHILDLQNLRSAMEGDRERKLELIRLTEDNNRKLEQELTDLLLAGGCREVGWKFPEETGFYQPIVIARK